MSKRPTRPKGKVSDRPPGPRSKKGSLPVERRKEMFAAFVETSTIANVVKKCTVNRTTANRYRLLDKWDERLAETQKLAHEIAKWDLAAATAESIIGAREIRRRLQKHIKEASAEGLGLGDLPKSYKTAIETERLLLGAPDKTIKLDAEITGARATNDDPGAAAAVRELFRKFCATIAGHGDGDADGADGQGDGP